MPVLALWFVGVDFMPRPFFFSLFLLELYYLSFFFLFFFFIIIIILFKAKKKKKRKKRGTFFFFFSLSPFFFFPYLFASENLWLISPSPRTPPRASPPFRCGIEKKGWIEWGRERVSRKKRSVSYMYIYKKDGRRTTERENVAALLGPLKIEGCL